MDRCYLIYENSGNPFSGGLRLYEVFLSLEEAEKRCKELNDTIPENMKAEYDHYGYLGGLLYEVFTFPLGVQNHSHESNDEDSES